MHVNFASLEFINIWKTNTAETDLDFCNVKAIINEAWKRIDKTNRHIVKRFAVYVFYHILCSTMDFHFLGDTCLMEYASVIIRPHATVPHSLGSLFHRAQRP